MITVLKIGRKMQTRKNKYHNRKVTRNGIKYDSLSEMRFHDRLLDQQNKGEIEEIILQPVYELQPSFVKDGKKRQPITYVADFYIKYADGDEEVIDVKGALTVEFKLKQKMFDKKYPDLRLVLWSECPKKFGGGFILLDELKKLRAKEKRAKRGQKTETKEIKQTGEGS